MSVQNNVEIAEATVARIDERTKSIQTELIQIRLDLKETIESVVDRIRDADKRHSDKYKSLEERQDVIVSKLEEEYVTKSEFSLIQKVVYGFIGLVLVAVVSAWLAAVVVAPYKDTRRSDAPSVTSSSSLTSTPPIALTRGSQ